jgi:hypothetical protein
MTSTGDAARHDAETARLQEDASRQQNWKRWGPYLSERQWGTVREDYSAEGQCWDYFPHDIARARAYRWGEDGLLGISDRQCRLCFALALWNGRDPILKERLFGLTGPQGNHGEDVKECYYYLDSTPTHSYMRALYQYPQREFPYDALVAENRRRGVEDPEYELLDTGVFGEDRYFDVSAEYAKAGAEDILIRIHVTNRGPERATLHVLPTLWFRNTWSWGREGAEYPPKPQIFVGDDNIIHARHATLRDYRLELDNADATTPPLLFTENETNVNCFGLPATGAYVKDAFHDYIVHGKHDVVNPARTGTKCAAHYVLDISAGSSVVLRLRLRSEAPGLAPAFGQAFDEIVELRQAEANAFYAAHSPHGATEQETRVMRQAYAGLLWSKQFYHYIVAEWLTGDPCSSPPPLSRLAGRNSDWGHVYIRDVLSMPDKWEYPWFASWDLAFHMIVFARIDPDFAKEQLALLTREWYMHPNGQIPAYEFAFGDVNPPVNAWACWRVYKMTAQRGERDRKFLRRVFHKLLMNFTWWVNRKDVEGNHLFEGGFLGLDNIGVFDRSRPLPGGAHLEQADGTAWMAFFCATMLSMALELARVDAAYEDIASTFFEHFIAITDAMNSLGGVGLWNEEDGFYYDRVMLNGEQTAVRIRSMVGIIPLFACEVLENDLVERLPGFRKRMEWFLQNRTDLAHHISYMEPAGPHTRGRGHRLLAIPSRERLERVLHYVLDEEELLSPHGVRSLSRVHRDHPYTLRIEDTAYRVDYAPAESRTHMFGGNSNWRGPVWLPLNYLLIEALERYHHFYGDSLKVECPTGSGNMLTLEQVSRELDRRVATLFLPNADGVRPALQYEKRFQQGEAWQDLLLFHEYFDGDTGRGVGASHQTGWTALAAPCIQRLARERALRTHPSNASD